PTGKPKYYMSRKPSGKPLDALPEGYEIYEHPEHGQVHVRKIRPSAITPREQELVAAAIRQYSGIEHVVVEVEEDGLVVWVPSMDVSATDDLIQHLAGAVSPSKARELRDGMLKRSRYEKLLRFALVDAQRRSFATQRWCFLGSIDNWIYVGRPARLADLVKEY